MAFYLKKMNSYFVKMNACIKQMTSYFKQMYICKLKMVDYLFRSMGCSLIIPPSTLTPPSSF